jgi:hypothetical protein
VRKSDGPSDLLVEWTQQGAQRQCAMCWLDAHVWPAGAAARTGVAAMAC